MLESMRLNKKARGFADGGFTSQTPNAGQSRVPNMLTSNDIANLPIFVSVTEIREVGNRVSVLENKASI